MVADICDEDELRTGTRAEGSFYSIYWWFIKMGSAFASFVTGALLVYTSFDERQNVTVDSLRGSIAVIKSQAEKWDFDDRIKRIAEPLLASAAIVERQLQPWQPEDATLKKNADSLQRRMAEMKSNVVRWRAEAADEQSRFRQFDEQVTKAVETAAQLQSHLEERVERQPSVAEHTHELVTHLRAFQATMAALQKKRAALVSAPGDLAKEADQLLQQTTPLKRQAPKTLFRLRLVEIGVPLALSLVSILLTLRYPLTEARCYEIKEALMKRHAKNSA
jgi:hypothetical protein